MKIKLSKLIYLFLAIFALIFILNIKAVGRYFFPITYSNYISQYSKMYDQDPYLVAAVIKTESNFNPKAKSNKDAYGLMQITYSTAESSAQSAGIVGFTADKLYDPQYNIQIGCWYLENLNQQFKNLDLVIAAYNGGRGNVTAWLNNPLYSKDGKTLDYIPFNETEKYLKKVKFYYNVYKWLYEK